MKNTSEAVFTILRILISNSSHHYHQHYNSPHAKHDHGENDDLNDFLNSKVGRAIYLACSYFFYFYGFADFCRSPIYIDDPWI